jgi:UDP-glucuronate decarboxylase
MVTGPVTIGNPQDDPMQRCRDITLARKLPGWQPEVALEDGLQRTIAYLARLLAERGGAAAADPDRVAAA